MKFKRGMVVVSTKWKKTFKGTVVNVRNKSAFVQWDDSFVEDEMRSEDIEDTGETRDESHPHLKQTSEW